VTGVSNVGGLAGYNRGSISSSYVSGGSVKGSSSNVGGLVGYNIGSIDGSYVFNTTVSGSFIVGGLVGYNASGGSINNSYVSGSTVSDTSSSGVGGLVGRNSGSISNSYVSNGIVSGISSVGGLVGNNNGSISNTYVSGGTVSGSSKVGGLVGLNDTSGTISDSFWDTQTTGQTIAVGGGLGTTTNVVGLLTADMMKMASFTNWDIANTGGAGSIWRIYDGYTTPLLTSFLKPLTITANPVSAVYTGAPYSGGLVNPVYSPPSPDLTHLLGNAYVNATNVGTYAPARYSDQQGYDISYVSGGLTITSATVTLITASDAPAIDEIVDITNQRPKTPEDVVVADTSNSKGTDLQSLPMCRP
jgi:The GLUG motif